jgi:uncharacterized protein (TIGR02246 family)
MPSHGARTPYQTRKRVATKALGRTLSVAGKPEYKSRSKGGTVVFTPDYQRVKCVLLLAAVVPLILALAGCQQPAPQAPDTRATDEATIRTAEADMAKAVAALDPVKAASFYTDDVVGMSADSPVIEGRENMQKYFETWMKDKPEVSWTPVKVEVARSGDLAYSWGKGKVSMKDKKGKVTETTDKYVSVWKKQADGSWKIAIDTMISDPPEAKK